MNETILIISVGLAVVVIVYAIMFRYRMMRGQKFSGKTLRGKAVRALSEDNAETTSNSGESWRSVDGEATMGIKAATECSLNGAEECDVYEDWVAIDGVRYTTGYHLENCRVRIESIDCGGVPGGGGGGGDQDPGPDGQRCLARSLRDYRIAIQNCRTETLAVSLAAFGVALLCGVLGIFTWPICALALDTAVAAAVAKGFACVRKAEREWKARNEDCLGDSMAVGLTSRLNRAGKRSCVRCESRTLSEVVE